MDEIVTNQGNDQLGKLRQVATDPTPQNDLRWRDAGGGKRFPYTDPDYVIRTLNDIFGFNWSFIVEHEEMIYFADQPFEIKVRGRLMVPLAGQKITKMQYGAATIEYKNNGRPVMIADAYKSAASDALKKCASELGIAHDVYDSDSYLFKGGKNNQQQQTRPAAAPASKQTTTSASTSTPSTNGTESPMQLLPLEQALHKLWCDSGLPSNQFLDYRAKNFKGKSEGELRHFLECWETVKALFNIWCEMGKPRGEFEAYWKGKLAAKTLTGLQEVRESWQQAALKRQQPATPPAEEKDKGHGLDQWCCTKESGSRKLALDVISATNRLEATGLSESQWRAEIEGLFPEYQPPISRKTLSPVECQQLVDTFNQWAAKREQDIAKAAQSARVA